MANNLNCDDLQIKGNLYVNGVITQNNTQPTDLVTTDLPFANLFLSPNGGNISFGNVERTLFVGAYNNWNTGRPPGSNYGDVWIALPSNGYQGVYYWNNTSWIRFI